MMCQGESRIRAGAWGCGKTSRTPRPAWPGAFLLVLDGPALATPSLPRLCDLLRALRAFVPGARKDKRGVLVPCPPLRRQQDKLSLGA